MSEDWTDFNEVFPLEENGLVHLSLPMATVMVEVSKTTLEGVVEALDGVTELLAVASRSVPVPDVAQRELLTASRTVSAALSEIDTPLP